MNQRRTTLSIPQDIVPDRADRVLSLCLGGDFSRSLLAKMIRKGELLVNGQPAKPAVILKPGDNVEMVVPNEGSTSESETRTAEFEILFEDPHIIIVDKPPGLVVHPGAGRSAGTLVDALVRMRPEMVGVGERGRWGVVHRLDRDTSGVMVFAKTSTAHAALSAMFKEHSIHRVYLALVRGEPGMDQGSVDTPVGRHPRDRKRISTKTSKPRAARTRWNVRERLGGLALLEVTPETGRTHQIRVHLASIGLPVAGDQVYGRMKTKGGSKDPRIKRALESLKRQALHAATLGFSHPTTKEYVEFESPLPSDMTQAISLCR